ncbi:MAG: hypothetical protein VR72_13120 [Clostridiaceae bacterium BRH_c20a]|nr:MAG: hypothetical protein VR72_13120 [Clostridiaceae bacterium BRH_c20a]
MLKTFLNKLYVVSILGLIGVVFSIECFDVVYLKNIEVILLVIVLIFKYKMSNVFLGLYIMMINTLFP